VLFGSMQMYLQIRPAGGTGGGFEIP